MNKILEALKKLLPEDQLNEVSSAIEEVLAESSKELESEFNEKLEEAYSELSKELHAAEQTAEKGYEEAFAIITDLNNRLDLQKEEFEKNLEEGYEEAYQMLLAERNKNSTLEVGMYDEYDKKLSEMKDYIVDKVDQFLQYKGAEIYEQAKKDVLGDPRYAEHKVALDKIVDTVANYISDEDQVLATSTKLENAHKQLEELKGQIKMMEARNIRLSHDNTKLNEAVRQHRSSLITENRADRKERSQKAKSVSGRGRTVVKEDVEVIAEYNREQQGKKNNDTDRVLVEGLDLETLNTLAGTKSQINN